MADYPIIVNPTTYTVDVTTTPNTIVVNTSGGNVVSSGHQTYTFVVATDGSGDYTTIEAAVAALDGNPGTIFIKKGVYTPASTLNIPSGVSIGGDGYSAQISAPSLSEDVFTLSSVSNVKISGLRITGKNTYDANQAGIKITSCTNILLENLFIEKMGYNGVHSPTSSVNVRIHKCVFDSNQYYGIHYQLSSDAVISDCIMNNNGAETNRHGINIDKSYKVAVTNCIAKNNKGAGIQVYRGVDVAISNCICYNNNTVSGDTYDNINVYGQAGENSKRVVISNCICYDDQATRTVRNGIRVLAETEEISISNCSLRGHSRNGIEIEGATKGVTITGCNISSNENRGLLLNRCQNVIVSDNIIKNNGTSGTSTQCIKLEGVGCSYINIQGNRIYDDQVSKTQGAIATDSNTDYITFINNQVYGNVSDAITLTGANNIVYGNTAATKLVREYTYVVATDGSGDYTTLNDAATALGTAVGTVFIKSGEYTPTDTITLYTGQRYIGSGKETTTLRMTSLGAKPLFKSSATGSATIRNCELRDFAVYRTGGIVSGQIGIDTSNIQRSRFANLEINYVDKGIYGNGINYYNEFQGIDMFGNTHNLYLENESNDLHFFGGRWNAGVTKNIYIVNCNNVTFNCVTFENASQTIHLDTAAKEIHFFGCRFESENGTILFDTGSERCMWFGGNIVNTTGLTVTDSGTTNMILYRGKFRTKLHFEQGGIELNNMPIIETKTITYQAEYDNSTSGATKTIDWNNGQNQKVTLSANCVFSFTAPSGPGTFKLKIIQDASTARTVVWPTMKWQGGLVIPVSTALSAVDILTVYYDGTSYYAQMGLGFA